MRSRSRGIAVAGLVLVAACSSGGPGAGRPRNDVPEPALSPPVAAAPAGSLITLPPGSAPEGLVADAVTGLLAVGVRNPDGVVLVGLTDRRFRARTVLTGAPRHLRVARPGGPLLVPAEGANLLYLLSLPAGQVTTRYATGPQPHDAASAGGGYFVGDELANTVHLFRPGQPARILPGPLQPGGLAASRDGSVVMVVGVRGRTIEEISSDGAILGSAPCGTGPTHVRAGPRELFYVADTEGDRILIFRRGRKGPLQLGSVPTRGAPYGLGVDEGRGVLYVTLTATNQLRSFRIQGDHLEPGRTWPTVRQPNDVTADDATGTVVIAGAAGNVLEFITPPVR